MVRRALVTGAGTRVGRAIALALGRRGMSVALHYHRSRTGAEDCAAEIASTGGEAVLVRADLSARKGAERLAVDSARALGGLDLIVLSAASFESARTGKVTRDLWSRTLALNTEAPFFCVQSALPALRKSRAPHVVFITCTSATSPYVGYLPYVVSKGATRSLMRVLALELAPKIRVNAVAPGLVLPPDGMDPRAIKSELAAIPLGRVGRAEDIAQAVLALDDAPFITGQELPVDGGATVGVAQTKAATKLRRRSSR